MSASPSLVTAQTRVQPPILKPYGSDLGWQVPPEQILAALNSCWALTLGRNAHVLAMTVPPLRSSVGVGRERDDLNASILAYKQTSLYVRRVPLRRGGRGGGGGVYYGHLVSRVNMLTGNDCVLKSHV